jgi:hypothetical protein
MEKKTKALLSHDKIVSSENISTEKKTKHPLVDFRNDDIVSQ